MTCCFGISCIIVKNALKIKLVEEKQLVEEVDKSPTLNNVLLIILQSLADASVFNDIVDDDRPPPLPPKDQEYLRYNNFVVKIDTKF